MIKELKYLFFVFIISLFIFFNLNFYFSETNKRNSYRSLKENDKKILNFSIKLTLLENNTNNIVEYIEKEKNKNKKNYNFWKLISKNE